MRHLYQLQCGHQTFNTGKYIENIKLTLTPEPENYIIIYK
jgi:hypothetical protein